MLYTQIYHLHDITSWFVFFIFIPLEFRDVSEFQNEILIWPYGLTVQVETEGGSPVDVARFYMKDRPPWASSGRNVELSTPLTKTRDLFKEGTSHSVGHDSFSSSKVFLIVSCYYPFLHQHSGFLVSCPQLHFSLCLIICEVFCNYCESIPIRQCGLTKPFMMYKQFYVESLWNFLRKNAIDC